MRTIGLLGDELHYDIPVNILYSLKQLSQERHLRFLYIAAQPLQTPNEFHIQSNILYNMVNHQIIDGLIICSNLLGIYVSPERFLERCRQYQSLPMVSLGIFYSHFPSILVNNEKGMYNAVSHLIDVHHLNHIAFLGGPVDHQDAVERFNAYCLALQDHHITLNKKLLLKGDFTTAAGTEAVKELIDKRKQIPGKDVQALVCCNDYMAIGAMYELQGRGYRIPNDLALIGFDDIPHVQCLNPPLSSVRQPFDQLTAKAVDLLLDMIDGKSVPGLVRIESEFISRASCGCRRIHLPELNHALEGEVVKLIHKQPDQFLMRLNRRVCNANRNYIRIWKDIFALLYQDQTKVNTTSRAWKLLAGTAYRAINEATQLHLTQSMGIALNSIQDFGGLQKLLLQRLPAIGIRRCYICLYENSEKYDTPWEMPVWSRIMIGFNLDKGEQDLPSGRLRFATQNIIPEQVPWMEDSWIIFALYTRDEGMGYLLLDGEAPNEDLYYLIRNQIAGVLKNILLLEERAKANAIIQEFNKQLKSENLQIKTKMKVARNIQTALLPQIINNIHPDFEITACMLPAEEVGGDYYDITLDQEGSLWFGIGDVSGHGLKPGLIMMQAQTVHTSLTTNYNINPAEALVMINKVLVKNVMERMKETHYMTCVLLKYLGKGLFQYAGMHLDLLVYRHNTGNCEIIETRGIWLNVLQDIAGKLENYELKLEPGDVLILYTDGIIEAVNADNNRLDTQGLIKLIIKHSKKKIDAMQQSIIQDVLVWNSGRYVDDMTLVIIRRIH